ncbi:hypothetical protein, conserved [Plasmodium gonderi]|uniref:EMP1-trafficking protein n=1 Tax=Plasmodium gonderi TaxID=77519 RepID=A0A1Y1JQ93_PLAGO|nr:hypothetical protein, conserved [Plasmodium gonderi]GAW83668.1 hypothetical protein, conserved [Plasmodium gonderi]
MKVQYHILFFAFLLSDDVYCFKNSYEDVKDSSWMLKKSIGWDNPNGIGKREPNDEDNNNGNIVRSNGKYEKEEILPSIINAGKRFFSLKDKEIPIGVEDISNKVQEIKDGVIKNSSNIAKQANKFNDDLKKNTKYWADVVKTTVSEELHQIDKYSKEQLNKLKNDPENKFFFTKLINFGTSGDDEGDYKGEEPKNEKHRDDYKDAETSSDNNNFHSEETEKGKPFWNFLHFKGIESVGSSSSKEHNSSKANESSSPFFHLFKNETKQSSHPTNDTNKTYSWFTEYISENANEQKRKSDAKENEGKKKDSLFSFFSSKTNDENSTRGSEMQDDGTKRDLQNGQSEKNSGFQFNLFKWNKVNNDIASDQEAGKNSEMEEVGKVGQIGQIGNIGEAGKVEENGEAGNSGDSILHWFKTSNKENQHDQRAKNEKGGDNYGNNDQLEVQDSSEMSLNVEKKKKKKKEDNWNMFSLVDMWKSETDKNEHQDGVVETSAGSVTCQKGNGCVFNGTEIGKNDKENNDSGKNDKENNDSGKNDKENNDSGKNDKENNDIGKDDKENNDIGKDDKGGNPFFSSFGFFNHDKEQTKEDGENVAQSEFNKSKKNADSSNKQLIDLVKNYYHVKKNEDEENMLSLLQTEHEHDSNINCHPLIAFKSCLSNCFNRSSSNDSSNINEYNNKKSLSIGDYKNLEKCILKCKNSNLNGLNGGMGCVQKDGVVKINKKQNYKDKLEHLEKNNYTLDAANSFVFSDFTLHDRYASEENKHLTNNDNDDSPKSDSKWSFFSENLLGNEDNTKDPDQNQNPEMKMKKKKKKHDSHNLFELPNDKLGTHLNDMDVIKNNLGHVLKKESPQQKINNVEENSFSFFKTLTSQMDYSTSEGSNIFNALNPLDILHNGKGDQSGEAPTSYQKGNNEHGVENASTIGASKDEEEEEEDDDDDDSSSYNHVSKGFFLFLLLISFSIYLSAFTNIISQFYVSFKEKICLYINEQYKSRFNHVHGESAEAFLPKSPYHNYSNVHNSYDNMYHPFQSNAYDIA